VIANAPAGTDVGAMAASTGNGFCKVTALLPVALTSAELTARTVTVLEVGTELGAVYIPKELIVPAAALPPVMPFTCQVTKVFEEPVTVALNDFVAPARTFALAGDTTIVTLGPAGGVPEFEGDEPFVAPVHPANAETANRNTESDECREVKSLNFSIRRHSESAALLRRLASNELCLDARCGTTVRKDKISRGTPEQDGEATNKLSSGSGKRVGDALAVLATRFSL
jgi:hypothetical protein